MNSFSIREIISSAWKNVGGVKWPIWLALIVAILITLGVGLITGLVTTLTGVSIIQASQAGAGLHLPVIFFIIIILFEIIGLFLTVPLTAGAQMAALKKVRGETVSASTGFGYWNKWFKLGLTVIFFSIGAMIVYLVFSFLAGVSIGGGLTWLGISFSIIGCIAFLLYYVFFIFNILFVADKDKGPFRALGCSAKAVAPHWFKLLLLFIYIGIVFVIATIPAVLGLMCPYMWVKIVSVLVSIFLIIWAVPYAHTLFTTAYNKLSSH